MPHAGLYAPRAGKEMPPLVSVVVPIYNVASYLSPCLESLASQSHQDLEVIVVDDGSTDESPAIATQFVEQDSRFRLVHQQNAGLGAARNTGLEYATGEFLAFVDGDDLVPPEAYGSLLRALLQTGSDFASGNVRRFTPFRTVRGSFLGQTFDRTRLRTHVTRFPRLLLDRTAWNKLFRRSFWDRHSFRFPEGVFYEDTPVTLPAHFVADSVDVLQDVVYLWRLREGADLSITDRRTDVKALRDRVGAVDYVSRFLAERGLKFSKLLYDRNVLAQDLAYFMAVLPAASEEFRATFVELANDFLDRVDSFAFDQPLAVDRLKWQLLRRRALPELLEVLRFERQDLAETPPIRAGRQWFGDYPFRNDPRLALPSSLYRLDDEFVTIARVEEIAVDGDAVRISGYAYIDLIGAPESGAQRVRLVARRRGWPPAKTAFETREVARPDLNPRSAQQLVSLDFAGFTAELKLSELGSREGTWDIAAVVQAEGRVRRNRRWNRAPLTAVSPVERRIEDGRLLRVELSSSGELTARIVGARAVVGAWRVDEGVLQLEGELHGTGSGQARLFIGGASSTTHPVHLDRADGRTTFLARAPLEELVEDELNVQIRRGEAHVPLELPPEARRALPMSSRPVIAQAEWAPEGTLCLSGSVTGSVDDLELVLAALGRPHHYPAGDLSAAGEGVFQIELTPAAIRSLAGEHPLAEGTWELLVRPHGATQDAPIRPRFGRELLAQLPLTTTVGLKRFHFGVSEEGHPVIAAERDLEEGERGGVAQRRLRGSFYPEARTAALRDAVLYECFGGSEYSDNPRAVYEELARRRAPLEHLWVVRDGAYAVPEGAVAIRAQSRAYYESYARARYVVSNDHWPRWCQRRSDQVWVQTWHGAPLKFQGRELEERPPAVRELRRALAQDANNWRYLVSPGAFASSILETSFAPVGEILETGLPRTDLLLAGDGEQRAVEVRERLGLGEQVVVLYAPTYRDDLDYAIGHKPHLPRDRPTYQSDLDYLDGYRLGATLDLAALAAALGEEYAVLFHKHARVVSTPAALGDARDVSDYPDGLELLLVADVLVTDYSSWLFDYAATGRPIILFAPDLEKYRDQVRGLHVDLADQGPGPVVSTTDQVIEAVRDLEGVQARFQQRYEAFVDAYCPLADGRASSRVVERVFGL
jgi:CDP-glycerol glycerophosphotransferase